MNHRHQPDYHARYSRVVAENFPYGFWMFARDMPEASPGKGRKTTLEGSARMSLHRPLFFMQMAGPTFLGKAGVAGHRAQACRSAPLSTLAEPGTTPPKQIERFLEAVCVSAAFQQQSSLPSPRRLPSAPKSIQWLEGKEIPSSLPTA